MEKKKALKNFLVWVIAAAIFDLVILYFKGSGKALEFAGGYVIEQSLSIDNIFLFLLIFTGFAIEPKFQKRILTYGIIGAMILRFVFIMLGIAIVKKFSWILYLFGFILILSGMKILFKKEESGNVKNSKFLKFIKKVMPVTEELHGEKFFVRKNKILYATPLFAILLLIEFSDIIFAIDSIPAIFSISTDTFIVYTSNIFAIIGLRNLYFLLEELHNSFVFVKYGVACILIFTGIKLAIVFFNIHISILLSLFIIFMIMVISIVASIYYTKNIKR